MIGKLFKALSRVVLPKVVVIGVDFQDQHISAVATERRGDENKILGSNLVTLPDSAITNGEVMDPITVESALQELMRGLPSFLFERFKQGPVFVISIPPYHIYTEVTEFPPLSDDDLEGAVKLKMETSLPWPIRSAYVDWAPIPARGKNKTGVFLSAVAKQTVDGFLNIFLRNGWQVAACEFHMVSLSRFVVQEKDPFLLVLIDEDGVEFAAFHEGRMITHYLQKVQRIDELNSLLKDKIRNLSTFVEGSLGVVVKNLFILDRFKLGVTMGVAEETRIPIREFPTFAATGLEFLIAQGASQREYGARRTFFNLLPEEATGRFHDSLLLKTLGLWTKVLGVFTFVFAFALVGMLMFVNNQRASLSRDVDELTATGGTRIASAETLIASANAFNELTARVEQIRNARGTIAQKLTSIEQEAFRTGVSVKNIKWATGETIALTADAPTRENAIAFKDALDKAAIFSSVTIPIVDLAQDQDITFHVTISL